MLINRKKIINKIHAKGFQIEKSAIHSIDCKLDAFIDKLCKQFNGHHKRIDATLVELIKL